MRTTLESSATTRSTPSSGSPVIEVSGLVKSYAGVRIVDDIAVHVDEGEIFALLGANGAGKTTTVECLQGLRRVDAGHLRVLGLDPTADRARLRTNIGSQLQHAALPDRLRVGEAVKLFDRRSGREPDSILEPWGLAPKRRASFADLSGGERQRLFIALALLNDPQVVFLDELTQGLDPAARRDTWQAISQIRDRGATVVLVTHFADEVEALCDRVAVMAHGQIVAEGTPRQLIDDFAPVTTVSFTAPSSFEPDELRRIEGVIDIARDGDHFRVVGTSEMIAPVCARTLDDRGDGPVDLHVSHPNLDDALVNLIGAQP